MCLPSWSLWEEKSQWVWTLAWLVQKLIFFYLVIVNRRPTSDTADIKENLLFLEKQQETTTLKSLTRSHDLNHGASQGCWATHCRIMCVGYKNHPWSQLFMGFLPTCITMWRIIIHLAHLFHWHITIIMNRISSRLTSHLQELGLLILSLFLCYLLLSIFQHTNSNSI
jgi:hypothetical protein